MSASHSEWVALNIMRYEVSEGRIAASPAQKQALDKRYKDLTLFILELAVTDVAFQDAQTGLTELKP